jgi:hypothetical protein
MNREREREGERERGERERRSEGLFVLQIIWMRKSESWWF